MGKMYLNHPLKVGKEAQDHPQLKRCWKTPSSCVEVDSHQNGNVHPSRKRNIHIVCKGWRCPPNFTLDSNWHVAAGEESQEVKAQKCREGRVLEALYPHPSTIPPSPSMSSDAYDGHLDDSHIPVIPLIPIEEEEAYKEAPTKGSIELQALHLPQATLGHDYLDTTLRDPPVSSEQPANVKLDIMRKPSVNAAADAGAAAAAAYTAILKCKEQGSLVDSDLLISILTNPELVQKLIVEHGFPENAVSEPAAALKQVISSTPDVGPKESCEECVVSVNAGTVPVSASTQVTFSAPLLNSHMDTDIRPFTVATATLVQPNMVTPLVPWSGKPSENLDACANTGLVHISGPITATSHVSLSDATSTMEMRFANRVGEPSCTGSGPLPGPKMVTREVTDEPLLPASVGFTPCSWIPSVPFRLSKSTEMLIHNLFNEFRGNTDTVSMQSAVVKPVALSASLCTLKPGVLECKKLISQYGNKKKDEAKLGSNPTTRSVEMPVPEAGAGKLKRPDSQSSLHLTPKNIPYNVPSLAITTPSLKDMEYFKNLIKKHGDGLETLKVDPVESGESHNYLQGSVTSFERKPVSEKPQCKFLNTMRGCRNGSNCQFQHNVENVPRYIGTSLEAPDHKRMKLSGEFGTKK